MLLSGLVGKNVKNLSKSLNQNDQQIQYVYFFCPW